MIVIQHRALCKGVEFVDIYPTVAELCNLSVPGKQDGRSLVPLLENPNQKWQGTAFTQILRPGDGKPFMGRSVRNDRWRYSDWNEGKLGIELYDHSKDEHEFINLAKDPQYEEIVHKLRSMLDKKVSGKVPETPFNPKRL